MQSEVRTFAHVGRCTHFGMITPVPDVHACVGNWLRQGNMAVNGSLPEYAGTMAMAEGGKGWRREPRRREGGCLSRCHPIVHGPEIDSGEKEFGVPGRIIHQQSCTTCNR